MSIQNSPDKNIVELIKKVQQKETNAFALFIKAIDGKLNGFIHSLVWPIIELQAIKDEDEKDIKQEVHIKFFLLFSGSGYKENSTFFELMYTITANCVTDFYKHHHPVIYDPEVYQYAIDTLVDETEEFADREEKEMLHEFLIEAFNHLSPQQQTVMILRTQHEMEFKNIGELLGIGSTDATSIYCKAKKKLILLVNKMRGGEEMNTGEKKVEEPVRKMPVRVVTTNIRASK
jgi:RNA polymerase sigma factor (sigma-70 family)